MTVEAVPVVDANGQPYADHATKRMHTTMQTLGRVAVVGGGIAVSLANILMFSGVAEMAEERKVAVYTDIYQLALVIPVLSVLGVLFAAGLKRARTHTLRRQGFGTDEIRRLLDQHEARPRANWWLLGGSLAFVLFTLTMGVSQIAYNQEIIFAGSMAIVLFLMAKLVRELPPDAGLDRAQCAAAIEGDILRGHGVVHQPGSLPEQPGHEVSEPALHRDAGAPRAGHRCHDAPGGL